MGCLHWIIGKQQPYLSIHGSSVKSITTQDGKLVLVGNVRLEDRPNSDFLLIRFLTDLNVGTHHPSLKQKETSIYPNPITPSSILTYELAQPDQLTIQLLDVNGKVIQTFLQNQQQAVGKQELPLDFSANLARGSYFITISSPNGQVAIKVMK